MCGVSSAIHRWTRSEASVKLPSLRVRKRGAVPNARKTRPLRAPVRLPVRVAREDAAPVRPDAPEVTVRSDSLTIHARSAATPGWRVAAYVYGIPWLVLVALTSLWYLIWGMPGSFFVRLILWAVLMLLTAALHATAALTLWGMAYARTGTETLIVDPKRITLRRQAGRLPIELHIVRSIVEGATPLPPSHDGRPRPRIEVKSWRSALRFGAGLTEGEAEECLYVLNAFFEREEYVRHALTTDRAGATIAPTRADEAACTDTAMTGTSSSGNGHEKRAGTVRARVARRM